MNIAALIDEAIAAGVTFPIVDGIVRMRAAPPPPPALLARLRAARHEIVEEIVARNERAALFEHYAGLERDEAELLAGLRPRAFANRSPA